MPLLNWNNSYSVNIAEIDNQHMKLVDLINRLFDAMKAGKGTEATGQILNELVTYTIYHFGYEEKLLASNQYPSLLTHKNEHLLLTKKVQELKAAQLKNSAVVTIETMNFLKDWLTNHIVKEDKKYSAFLNAKGIK